MKEKIPNKEHKKSKFLVGLFAFLLSSSAMAGEKGEAVKNMKNVFKNADIELGVSDEDISKAYDDAVEHQKDLANSNDTNQENPILTASSEDSK